VFVFAFLKPKRQLQPHEVAIKEAAKKIVAKISKGEQVSCSVVHFSEICNILEYHMPREEALAIEQSLLFRENIHFHEVSKDDYLTALSIAQQDPVGINDAVAYVLMNKTETVKIYSFDKHFDRFSDIERLTE
jgi:predicted nucleic acid-binding protein